MATVQRIVTLIKGAPTQQQQQHPFHYATLYRKKHTQKQTKRNKTIYFSEL